MVNSEKSINGYDVTKNQLISEYMSNYTPNAISNIACFARDWKEWDNLMEVVDILSSRQLAIITAGKIKNKT